MIKHAKGTVEYQETGAGVSLVFVPGSFSTRTSWRNITTPLSEHYRTITTSLSGYGKTQERRAQCGPHMQDEMDVLEAVLAKANAPVNLVAHSFGAWVVLRLVMHRKPDLLSLTLLEPTAFNLLTSDRETSLREQVRAMKESYVTPWRSGDQRALRHVIDFYGGVGTFDAYPPAVQDKVIAQTPTNVLDWDSDYAEVPVQLDFSTVNVPTLVICGNASHLAGDATLQPIAGRPLAPGPTDGFRWCQPFHDCYARCRVDPANKPAYPRSVEPLITILRMIQAPQNFRLPAVNALRALHHVNQLGMRLQFRKQCSVEDD
jgi:pimeloyl-ACP methyl ester carboxylesterase